MIEKEPMLKVAEIARLLRISKWTVYRLIDDGELRAIRVGKKSIRVPESAYIDYVAEPATALMPARTVPRDGDAI